MKIEFEDIALEELYTNGATTDGKYRKLPKDIIRQYVKVVNYIKAVRRLEDLFYIKSLHYEKKKGDLKGVDAVWINKQYRLFFRLKVFFYFFAKRPRQHTSVALGKFLPHICYRNFRKLYLVIALCHFNKLVFAFFSLIVAGNIRSC